MIAECIQKSSAYLTRLLVCTRLHVLLSPLVTDWLRYQSCLPPSSEEDCLVSGSWLLVHFLPKM